MKSIILSSLLSFLGILLIGLIHFNYGILHSFTLLIASLGATSTIIFCLWGQPVSKFWNLSIGHLIGATIGVCCHQFIFEYSPILSFSLALSTTIFLMHITKSVHPPAGAVALIATSNEPLINEMGWLFIPAALLGAWIIYSIGWVAHEKLGLKPKSYW